MNLKLVKLFNLVLFVFKFSGEIINTYWIKLMVNKVVADFKEHLFHQEIQIGR